MVAGHALGRHIVHRPCVSFRAGIAERKGMDSILHYLDDYLMVGRPEGSECDRFLNTSTLLDLFLCEDVTIVRKAYPSVLHKWKRNTFLHSSSFIARMILISRMILVQYHSSNEAVAI